MSQTTVTVKILDRDYQVTCPPEERAALIKSAEYLDRRMREVRDAGKVVGVDRMAVMVALNLASELLAAHTGQAEFQASVGARLRAMHERLDASVAAARQQEF
jgi:cell division protein ZapA